MKDYSIKSSAHEAGEGLQIEILKNGLTSGAINQIREIILRHPNDVLKSFFAGLLGVGDRD